MTYNAYVTALEAVIARLVSDWDYKLGTMPTWVGPHGEAEPMSANERRIILTAIRVPDVGRLAT